MYYYYYYLFYYYSIPPDSHSFLHSFLPYSLLFFIFQFLYFSLLLFLLFHSLYSSLNFFLLSHPLYFSFLLFHPLYLSFIFSTLLLLSPSEVMPFCLFFLLSPPRNLQLQQRHTSDSSRREKEVKLEEI